MGSKSEMENLNRDLQEAVQDLSMLFELSNSLVSTLDKEVMLEQAIIKIHDSVPRIHGGMIMLRDGEDAPLKQMVTIGYAKDHNHESETEITDREAAEVAEAVVTSGESYCWTGRKLIPAVQCSCMTGVPDPDQLSPMVGDRTMGIPLVVKDQVAGSLVLSMNGKFSWLTPRDLSLIQTIAGQLTLAVENAILFQEVKARDALRGRLLRQVVSAQEQERIGIARDLHDGVGQLATAIGLGLAAASESVQSDPELAEKQLRELKAMSSQFIQELQVVISGLRPTVLDNLGLVPALADLLKAFQKRTEIGSIFTIMGNQQRIIPELETILFRIAQEGLSNVLKHANATRVKVILKFSNADVSLSIVDNGRGFNPQEVFRSDPQKHWGLIGICERVALVGGTCNIDSKLGNGASIQIQIPLGEIL